MKTKKLKLALLLGLCFSQTPVLQASEVNLNNYLNLTTQEQESNFTKFTVKFKEGYTVEDLSRIISKDITVFQELFMGYKSLIVVGEISKEELMSSNILESVDIDVKMIMSKKDFEYDYGVDSDSMTTATSDPYYYEQKHFKETSEYAGASSIERAIDEKQQNNNDNKNIYIGIVDTGSLSHEDLIFNSGENFVSETNREFGYQDISLNNGMQCTSGHGVQVAGVISALMDNNVGVSGIVNANLVAARVAEMNCLTGLTQILQNDVANAVFWLSGGSVTDKEDIKQPVDIINMSISGKQTCSATLQAAINYSLSQNIIISVAAGNADEDVKDYAPANCNGVLVVANNDEVADKASTSNYGEKITLSALGQGIKTTSIGDTFNSTYTSVNGTSFSSPIVAGIAGLLKEKYVDLITPSTAKYLLQEGATEHSGSFTGNSKDCLTDGRCGSGVVNAYNSMKLADQIFGFKTSVSHFYSDKNSCKGEAYLQSMTDLGVNVCDLYKVKVDQVDSLKELKYQVIKRVESANVWTSSNSQMVGEFSVEDEASAVTYRLTEREDGYEYGIRICDEDGICFNSQDLDFTKVTMPDYCN